MKNFKEIAEKCLAGELSGTFVTAFDNNWHSSYLQRYAILGHEMPEQYVLGPGIIYNDRGQCTSNEKVKIVDFIPDTMKNFKEIAEKCLAGELSGTFVFQNGQKISSSKLQKFDTDVPYGDYPYYISHVCTLTNYGFGCNSNYNVIDFIPDKMTQKKIEIDIPEGKVPVMEQTENGITITWANKDITYKQVLDYLNENHQLIQYQANMMVNKNDSDFLRKVNVIGKLTNIRNYFGKPEGNENGFYINLLGQAVPNGFPAKYASDRVVFAKQEHAEQAIKMLGDELKYLFEPW